MNTKRQFSWKHPWSNAADTYMAQRLRERYLYLSPEFDYPLRENEACLISHQQ